MQRLIDTLGKLDLIGVSALAATALVVLLATAGEVAGLIDSTVLGNTPLKASSAASCSRQAT